MKSSVITFPGSNCDRDMDVALNKFGFKNKMVWHDDNELPKSDLVVLPGGFSYGDYLRCGSMASKSKIMHSVINFAKSGGLVMGICNGFQVLTEAGLLPGALQKNNGLKFLCKTVQVRVETENTTLTRKAEKGMELSLPINHFEGNFTCDLDTLNSLIDHDRVVLRYCDNPNGSIDDIAGVCNETRNVVGLMPHPERACDLLLGSEDGKVLFESLLGSN